MRNRSFKLSQNWLSNHMTSQVLLDAQILCLANYAHLAIFLTFVTLEREEILRSAKLHSSVLNGLSRETIKRQPKISFHMHFTGVSISSNCMRIQFLFQCHNFNVTDLLLKTIEQKVVMFFL